MSLAFAAGVQAQEGAPKELIRFPDGKVELCEIGAADAEGVVLKLEGLPRPVRFRWWQIAPEDAARIREARLGKGAPESVPAPGGLLIPGLRIRTREGKSIEGFPEAGAPAGKLWIKSVEGRHVIEMDSVTSREEIQIDLVRVYTPDEAVSILVGRLRPQTPEDYDKLGSELLRAKLEARAQSAFKMAGVLRNPERPEARLARVLIRLRERLDDLAVRKSVFSTEERALAGDYDAALEELEALEKLLAGNPEALEELRRVRGELQSLRGRARDDRILDEAWRTIEAMTKTHALDRSLTMAAGKAWALERLPVALLEHLRVKFNFSPEDPALRLLWERRPEGPVFKHAYDDATWVVMRPELRDPEPWWAQADDAARHALLMGWFVERHLQVKRVEEKSCARCGGTGRVETVTDAAVPAPALCGSCQGLKSSRVLIYR